MFLLVAAVVLAVPTALQLRRDAEVFTDIAAIPLLFDGFTQDNVGQVLLAQPKKEQPPPDPQQPDQKRVAYDQLLLQRGDKGWQLGVTAGDRAGVPVDKGRVETDVFLPLRSIRSDRERIVQPNATPEQLAEYGLDEAQAFVIKAFDPTGKNAVAELLVGKDVGVGQSGTDVLRGTYVRRADSSDVLLHELERMWTRDVREETWIDRMLFRLDRDKVRRLSIRNVAGAGATFVFERLDGKASWQAKDPPADVGAVRQSEVEALLQRLLHVSVQDYRLPAARVPNAAQLGLAPAQIEIAIGLRDGDQDRVVTLAVGNKVDGKNEYYLQSSESPFVCTWPAGLVPQFEVDVKAQCFDPKGPPESPPDAPREK